METTTSRIRRFLAIAFFGASLVLVQDHQALETPHTHKHHRKEVAA
jgi:hypothetical protein